MIISEKSKKREIRHKNVEEGQVLSVKVLCCFATKKARKGYSSCHLSLPKNFNLTSLYRNERKLKEGLTVRISTQATSVKKRRSL